jgi:cation diffusion facilitator CzcD-associated flavoprotein CzcO
MSSISVLDLYVLISPARQNTALNGSVQIIKDSIEQEEAKRFSTNQMITKLDGDTVLIKHLIPDFAVGCRRPTPGNGYLEALTNQKVNVVTEEISEIVAKGIKLSTGKVLEVDTFICATGFDISFSPRFPLIGRSGISLSEQWKTRPEAYLGMAAANIPNYFSMYCLLRDTYLYLLITIRSQCSLDQTRLSAMDPYFRLLSRPRNT